jgi:hypothetical protein
METLTRSIEIKSALKRGADYEKDSKSRKGTASSEN